MYNTTNFGIFQVNGIWSDKGGALVHADTNTNVRKLIRKAPEIVIDDVEI